MSAEGDGRSWLDVEDGDPGTPGLDDDDWDPDAPGLDDQEGGPGSSWPGDRGVSSGSAGLGRDTGRAVAPGAVDTAGAAVPEAWDAGFLPRDVAPSALSGLPAGPAGGFAAGNELDIMLPGVTLAGFADDVTGPAGRCATASDDQLVGVLRAWDRLESWTAARKLAVVAELIRRRPAPGCCPGRGRSDAGRVGEVLRW